MTIIVPNLAEVALLDGTWSGLADDLELRLYQADVTAGLTPAQIQVLTETDFTEANFTGYTAVSLPSAGWTITAGDPTGGVHAVQSFISTADQAAQTIWGYYVVDDTSGEIRWFEQFPGPVLVEFDQDEIQVTPTLTLDDREGNAVPIGEITAWPSDTIPATKLLCDGSAVSRSTYSLLFAVIGETYGAGDGSTTFNLPDGRQTFLMGKADAGTGSALGDTGGEIDHVHDLDTASSHAKITVSTSDVPYQLRRQGLPQWTADRQGNGSGGNSTASSTSATQLAGDTDTANPPFVTVHWVIQALPG
jgi:microcystin-dependent protein